MLHAIIQNKLDPIKDLERIKVWNHIRTMVDQKIILKKLK